MNTRSYLLLFANHAIGRVEVARHRTQTGQAEVAACELATALDHLKELRRLLEVEEEEDSPSDRLERLRWL